MRSMKGTGTTAAGSALQIEREEAGQDGVIAGGGGVGVVPLP